MRSLDLPVFSHPSRYADNFNCGHVELGFYDNSVNGECLAGWKRIKGLALSCNAKNAKFLNKTFYTICS